MHPKQINLAIPLLCLQRRLCLWRRSNFFRQMVWLGDETPQEKFFALLLGDHVNIHITFIPILLHLSAKEPFMIQTQLRLELMAKNLNLKFNFSNFTDISTRSVAHGFEAYRFLSFDAENYFPLCEAFGSHYTFSKMHSPLGGCALLCSSLALINSDKRKGALSGDRAPCYFILMND